MTISSQKIVPHLWFDKEAREAAEFYTSIFPDSMITSVTTLKETPSGDSEIVSFELWGQKFMSISGGPFFNFNPSISFFVNFDPSRDEKACDKIVEIWNKLYDGGTVLMPLDSYPFSDKYGWIQDKYGLTWQLILTNPDGEERPTILPSLMFVGDNYGNAEEAFNYYLSVFQNSEQGNKVRYPEGMEPNKEGTIMFSDFCLMNQWFTAMDSATDHRYGFNEAVSFMVYCDTQEEIDYYWNKLSAVPDSEQCGWLKDKFGLSWQIVPEEMNQVMTSSSPEELARVNEVILKMKKLDLGEIRRAFRGL